MCVYDVVLCFLYVKYACACASEFVLFVRVCVVLCCVVLSGGVRFVSVVCVGGGVFAI